jgi:hypothetical protein
MMLIAIYTISSLFGMVSSANLTAIKMFSLPFIAEAIYIGYQALRKLSPKV